MVLGSHEQSHISFFAPAFIGAVKALAILRKPRNTIDDLIPGSRLIAPRALCSLFPQACWLHGHQ